MGQRVNVEGSGQDLAKGEMEEAGDGWHVSSAKTFDARLPPTVCRCGSPLPPRTKHVKHARVMSTPDQTRHQNTV
jgi:hypothetical protein